MDIARGIDKMHSRRLVHLDLKSPNVLLSASGTAKIAVRTCPGLYSVYAAAALPFTGASLGYCKSHALRIVAALQGVKHTAPSTHHADNQSSCMAVVPALVTTLLSLLRHFAMC